mmetsp:Transcript_30508/g.65723  ORF Transcript_30508/g.65723 Transcript_30508/m.65723 type:complete len:333 (+) Transcript_30508:92-1090(+)
MTITARKSKVEQKIEAAELKEAGILTQIAAYPGIKPAALWVLWLLTGTLFYCYELELGWGKGFYMAVNVGYSIGWGYPAENHNGSRLFSTAYVLLGASAVAASLGYFAQSMIDSSQDWYAAALAEEKLKTASKYQRMFAWYEVNCNVVHIIALWLVWIAVLVLFSMVTIKWNFTEALLFAVSSLSTGGLWKIPDDSPEWYFGFVGAMSALGVPLMGLAMASIAAMVITIGDPDEAKNTIAKKVTMEELKMMHKFDLDDGDGEISRAEFILLCSVRLGALSPDLIGMINERFKILDVSRDRNLSHAEILEDPQATATWRNTRSSRSASVAAAC